MSERLKHNLLRRIRESGPISFPEFMSASLYDPNDGFYARHPVGDQGDFVTSPHVSKGFGELIEKMLFGMWWRLARPKQFDLVEAGAGNGMLARAVLDAARSHDAFDTELRYSGVDVSAGARDAIKRMQLQTYADIKEIPVGVRGCILANELLDNLPFHRVRRRNGALSEVFVDASPEDELIEVERPCTLEVACDDGEEVHVSPAIDAFVAAAIAKLHQGWLVLFDYGHSGDEEPLPVRSYANHELRQDWYRDPGSADITAGVDFDHVAKTAVNHGARVFGPRTQRDVLKSLGFDSWYASLRSSRLQAESKRDTKAILALVSEQSKAPLLVDASHLGGLKAIAIAVGMQVAPPGFE